MGDIYPERPISKTRIGKGCTKVTQYFCEKCGSKLNEIPQDLSGDVVLECPKCQGSGKRVGDGAVFLRARVFCNSSR